MYYYFQFLHCPCYASIYQSWFYFALVLDFKGTLDQSQFQLCFKMITWLNQCFFNMDIYSIFQVSSSQLEIHNNLQSLIVQILRPTTGSMNLYLIFSLYSQHTLHCDWYNHYICQENYFHITYFLCKYYIYPVFNMTLLSYFTCKRNEQICLLHYGFEFSLDLSLLKIIGNKLAIAF